MKKTVFYPLLLLSLVSLSSCEMFEVDNYEAPGETLQGEVIDVLTGDPVLTDQSADGIRVRLIETSWDPSLRDPAQDVMINCMPDGKFQHTKLFKGIYKVVPYGPFIPLIRRNANREIIADDTKLVKVSGVNRIKFEVQPFLNVKIVGEPTASNGKITARVFITRGVAADDFRAKIQPTGEWATSLLNVTDIRLFVSYSSSVGLRAHEATWSSKIDYAGSAFNSLFGEPIAVQSNGIIPSGRIVYVRAAARIDYATDNVKRYNYSEPVQVVIP
jgi:hypothetical protein